MYGYSDSDWSDDKGDRKSTTSYVFIYGDAPITTSCEVEYIAASMVVCQAQWLSLSMLMQELSVMEDEKIRLLVDNKSAIDLAKHLIAHGRSKHIETRFHFLRHQMNKEKLELQYCKTEEQVADLLNKLLETSTILRS